SQPYFLLLLTKLSYKNFIIRSAHLFLCMPKRYSDCLCICCHSFPQSKEGRDSVEEVFPLASMADSGCTCIRNPRTHSTTISLWRSISSTCCWHTWGPNYSSQNP